MITTIVLEGMPVKADSEYDGNSMLWAGLMCASGDLSSAQGIKDCQDETGRLWRSPRRKGVDTEDSFSRDMALGFLLYVAKSRDFVTYEKWRAYIDQTNDLCPDANDGRDEVTLPLQWQWDRIKTRAPACALLWPYLMAAALTSPEGYQLHLVGVHLLLDWVITGSKSTLISSILNKRQPLNPFFQWLADEPVILPPEIEGGFCNQWSWERADSEEAWRNSMGWDFIFMRNLMAMGKST